MCLAFGDELELVQLNCDYHVPSFVASLTARGGHMTQNWSVRCKRKPGGVWGNFHFSILNIDVIIGFDLSQSSANHEGKEKKITETWSGH